MTHIYVAILIVYKSQNWKQEILSTWKECKPDTLSFYVVFLSSHIKPDSVNSYLSGICRQLEPFFPDIRHNRKSLLVSRTLTGCMRRFGTPVNHKSPLSIANLQLVLDSIVSEPTHDKLLFAALLLTAFYALMRLGELVFSDKKNLRNYRKISLRHIISILPTQYSFFLPSNKGDRFFEGNTIVVQKLQTSTDPYMPFLAYLTSRDQKFPLHPELWLTSEGKVPTHHWFIKHLRKFFPNKIAGQSLWSGGATSLAGVGASLDTIQAAGRWSSDAFRIYIRKNPFIISHHYLWTSSPSTTWLKFSFKQHIFTQFLSIAPLFLSFYFS